MKWQEDGIEQKALVRAFQQSAAKEERKCKLQQEETSMSTKPLWLMVMSMSTSFAQGWSQSTGLADEHNNKKQYVDIHTQVDRKSVTGGHAGITKKDLQSTFHNADQRIIFRYVKVLLAYSILIGQKMHADKGQPWLSR